MTPWKSSDGQAWWRIAAQLVPADRVEQVATALSLAEDEIWRRSRVEHRSGTLAEVFSAAGLSEHDLAHAVHDDEWEWATYLDPDAVEVLTGLREREIRVGVLSNTSWPRARAAGAATAAVEAGVVAGDGASVGEAAAMSSSITISSTAITSIG